MKYCRVCGKKSNSYYCSLTHKREWFNLNPRHDITCAACGNQFKTNNSNAKYCSFECALRSPHRAIKGRGNDEARFINRFNKRFGDGFEYVGGYVNRDSSFQCRCRKCEDVFSWSASTVRNNAVLWKIKLCETQNDARMRG